VWEPVAALDEDAAGSGPPAHGSGTAQSRRSFLAGTGVLATFDYVSHHLERHGPDIFPEGHSNPGLAVAYEDLEPYFTRFEYDTGMSGRTGNPRRADGGVSRGPRRGAVRRLAGSRHRPRGRGRDDRRLAVAGGAPRPACGRGRRQMTLASSRIARPIAAGGGSSTGRPVATVRRALGGARRPAAPVLAAQAGALVLVAGTLHLATMLLWHLPPLFDAAVASSQWHRVEHATLLGTAVIAWSAVGAATWRGTRPSWRPSRHSRSTRWQAPGSGSCCSRRRCRSTTPTCRSDPPRWLANGSAAR
jgi:hypothetical protein